MPAQNSPEIVRALSMFGFGKVQDFATMIRLLHGVGVEKSNIADTILEFTDTTLVEMVKQQNKGIEEHKRKMALYEKRAPRCPDCEAILKIKPIQVPKGIRNVQGYRTHWYCDNDDKGCTYEKFTVRPFHEEMAALGIRTPPVQDFAPTKVMKGEYKPKTTPEENVKEARRKPCQGCG